MGIPIDGSIESFDAQIKSKGFVDSERYVIENTSLEKWYDGVFAGHNVNVTVFATPKTQIVYNVTVSIFDDEQSANELCQHVKKTIEDKYKVDNKIVNSENNIRYEVGCGDIVVEYNSDEKNARIMYFDVENTNKCSDEEKEDI